MDTPSLADVRQVHDALEPTRWVLLHRAATRSVFRAEEALPIARAEAGFGGSEQTARYHATWLERRGYLSRTTDQGRLAYRITDAGRNLYERVVAATGTTESVQRGTDSQLLALVVSLAPHHYDALVGDPEELDVLADLRRGLESVLTTRARVRVDPTA